MCFRTNSADFYRHVRCEKRTLQRYIQSMQEHMRTTPCCGSCFAMKTTALEIEFYSSIHQILATGSCTIPLLDTFEKLNSVSQEALDGMLLDDIDPGVLFHDGERFIAYDSAPGECVRIHGEAMVHYREHYMDDIDRASEIAMLHLLFQ